MIVMALVGLVIGVLLGFGFRGSLADVLNLEASFMQPQAVATTTWEQSNHNLVLLKKYGLKETDFYGNATGVEVPSIITIDKATTQSILGGQWPFVTTPSELSFDLGTMTAAEKTAVDACMDGSTDQNPPATYSSCLVENVIKTRATVKQP